MEIIESHNFGKILSLEKLYNLDFLKHNLLPLMYCFYKKTNNYIVSIIDLITNTVLNNYELDIRYYNNLKFSPCGKFIVLTTIINETKIKIKIFRCDSFILEKEIIEINFKEGFNSFKYPIDYIWYNNYFILCENSSLQIFDENYQQIFSTKLNNIKNCSLELVENTLLIIDNDNEINHKIFCLETFTFLNTFSNIKKLLPKTLKFRLLTDPSSNYIICGFISKNLINKVVIFNKKFEVINKFEISSNFNIHNGFLIRKKHKTFAIMKIWDETKYNEQLIIIDILTGEEVNRFDIFNILHNNENYIIFKGKYRTINKLNITAENPEDWFIEKKYKLPQNHLVSNYICPTLIIFHDQPHFLGYYKLN